MSLTGEYELSPSDWVRKQTERILETGTTDGVDIQGMPVVLLTMKGAKTGKVRKMPVMRVERHGAYAAVASKGGAPENPSWYSNLKANPDILLQDGTVTKEYRAREVSGDERSEWWKLAVAAYPPYAEYQTKTDRLIPVFVLEER